MAEQLGLCPARAELPKQGFLTTPLIVSLTDWQFECIMVGNPELRKLISYSTQLLSMKFKLLINIKKPEYMEFPALNQYKAMVTYILLINVKMPTSYLNIYEQDKFQSQLS